jgi:hypothetical protein
MAPAANAVRNVSPVKDCVQMPSGFKKRKPDLSMLRVFGCLAFLCSPRKIGRSWMRGASRVSLWDMHLGEGLACA